MRSVLLWKDMDQVAEQMDAAVFQYVGELQTESFEAFADFDLLAFDWYDVRKAGKSGKVLVYIDREDLFFFCRNEAAQQYVQGAVDTLTAGGPLNDQQLLYRFFAGLFKGDMAYLEKLEAQINGGESTILEGKAKDDAPRRIAAWRRELLHLKRYYEQLDAIFDEMCDNDNGLIEANILARLEVLGRRTGRYLQKVCALQELVAQLREAYQSQLAIQQNDLMRVFTIVTVLFLPLTLITGWFGMNFVNMPELQSEWGYPVIIAASILLVARTAVVLQTQEMAVKKAPLRPPGLRGAFHLYTTAAAERAGQQRQQRLPALPQTAAQKMQSVQDARVLPMARRDSSTASSGASQQITLSQTRFTPASAPVLFPGAASTRRLPQP